MDAPEVASAFGPDSGELQDGIGGETDPSDGHRFEHVGRLLQVAAAQDLARDEVPGQKDDGEREHTPGAELVFGQGIDDLSPRQIAAFVLPAGLAWIATGLWLDVTRRRDYATWAHLVGLVLTGIAVVAMAPKTVPGFAVIGLLGALALFFSAFVRHWSFTVIGALGVLMATMSAMSLLGGIAPLVIAVVGIALIFVGLRWSRWRESIRSAVLARMPATARNFVTRLAP